jgi:alkylation response protein AidB-like acyl-CoA dehydrogenase
MLEEQAWEAEQGFLAESLGAFCRDRAADFQEVAFSRESWRGLAALGVFEAAVPGAEVGAAELVTLVEVLGDAVFPGPLCETILACGVLPEPERQPILCGERIVCVARDGWMPFAPLADVFLERGEDSEGRSACWRATPRAGWQEVETLGGEPWGHGALDRGEALAGAPRAALLSDLARSGYWAAAGRRLLVEACEHARTRKQFGHTIGDFQAVAHPLAELHMRLVAARGLVRRGALAIDAGAADAAVRLGAAQLSAAAAGLLAVQTCHQVFGAVGITLEGPAFRVSRRIRHSVTAAADLQSARDSQLRQWGLEGDGR